MQEKILILDEDQHALAILVDWTKNTCDLTIKTCSSLGSAKEMLCSDRSIKAVITTYDVSDHERDRDLELRFFIEEFRPDVKRHGIAFSRKNEVVIAGEKVLFTDESMFKEAVVDLSVPQISLFKPKKEIGLVVKHEQYGSLPM